MYLCGIYWEMHFSKMHFCGKMHSPENVFFKNAFFVEKLHFSRKTRFSKMYFLRKMYFWRLKNAFLAKKCIFLLKNAFFRGRNAVYFLKGIHDSKYVGAPWEILRHAYTARCRHIVTTLKTKKYVQQ